MVTNKNMGKQIDKTLKAKNTLKLLTELQKLARAT